MTPWMMSGKAGGTGDGTAVTERLARYEARLKPLLTPDFAALYHRLHQPAPSPFGGMGGFPMMGGFPGLGGSMGGFPQSPQSFIQYPATQQQAQDRRRAALSPQDGGDQ